MHMLERDGKVYERVYLGVKPPSNNADDDTLLQEYVWLDQDFCDEIQDSGNTFHTDEESNVNGQCK